MQRKLTIEHAVAWLKYFYRTRTNHSDDQPDYEEWTEGMKFMPDDLLNFLANEYTQSSTYRKTATPEKSGGAERIAGLAKQILDDRADSILVEGKKPKSEFEF